MHGRDGAAVAARALACPVVAAVGNLAVLEALRIERLRHRVAGAAEDAQQGDAQARQADADDAHGHLDAGQQHQAQEVLGLVCGPLGSGDGEESQYAHYGRSVFLCIKRAQGQRVRKREHVLFWSAI